MSEKDFRNGYRCGFDKTNLLIIQDLQEQISALQKDLEKANRLRDESMTAHNSMAADWSIERDKLREELAATKLKCERYYQVMKGIE